MVVLDKEDYVSKAQELVSQLAYKEIPRDPTNKIKACPSFMDYLKYIKLAIL